MKEIQLTQGKVALVDDEDFEWISKYSWHCNHEYASRTSSRILGPQVAIFMHREIMNASKGYEIDHINGNMLDNRKQNLRICKHSDNSKNTKIRNDNTSGYKGVVKGGKKWDAQIKFKGKLIRLGRFENIVDAAKKYDEKAIELFGEFARTNF